MLSRVIIVGNAAGGKTRLAKSLADLLEISCVHIDKLQWGAGWTRASEGDFKRRHADVLSQKKWLIDGVGPEEELYVRLRAADTIIFIDLPVAEHIRLATHRSAEDPVVPAPEGCSYESNLSDVMEIIRRLDSTLIPQLRVEIPRIVVTTKAQLYHITRLEEKEELLASVGKVCKAGSAVG
ncbi:MAG: hypothetical protein AABY34_04390 [Pseudomonadota bacterium]